MGQGASKSVPKEAQRAAQKLAMSNPGQLPPRPPPRTPGPPPTVPVSEASNQAQFLRGEGIAAEDVRDKGQELYLQHRYKIDDETKNKGTMEMPDDLLKFIQDAGPAKQAVDSQFTAPNLLQKGNESLLHQAESSRSASRVRRQMPLIGEDDTYTTTKNTNFARDSALANNQSASKQEFGLTNMQFFSLVSGSHNATTIPSFYETVLSQNEEMVCTPQEKEMYQKLLSDALNAVEVPVLMRDSHGNFLGLHPKDATGPEVMALKTLTPDKVKFVLQDLTDKEEGQAASDNLASTNLEKRRMARKSRRRIDF